MRTKLGQVLAMALIVTLPGWWAGRPTSASSDRPPVSAEDALSITLDVVDGPDGARPQLAIGISAEENGRLGAGAELTGMATIAPCRGGGRVGASAGVGFDRRDAWCLDGARLLPIGRSGDHAYVFRADDGAEVVAHYADAAAAQPERFEMTTLDGVRRRFEGWRAAAGDVDVMAAYLLARVVDAEGREIAYRYERDEGTEAGELSYRLARIDYGFAGARVDGEARRAVVFRYEARPDVLRGYLHGVRSRVSTRLAAVEMVMADALLPETVWSYQLGYADDGARSVLRQVSRCTAAGACTWSRTL